MSGFVKGRLPSTSRVALRHGCSSSRAESKAARCEGGASVHAWQVRRVKDWNISVKRSGVIMLRVRSRLYAGKLMFDV
jgi:hypothetical protein